MLSHIVLIAMPDDAPDERIEAIITGLRALPAQIDAIESYDVGRDLGLAPGNAAITIQAAFASPEALRTYIDHPAHQQVVTELIRPFASGTSRAQVALD